MSGAARLSWRTLLLEEARLLAFRAPGPALATHRRAFLAFGAACTWLAGVGRYWDHPTAALWQKLGVGSLAYVVLLAALVWVLLLPLKPKRWSYANVLLFVMLTSPLAWLYALPVERWMPLEEAASMNVWFLAIVATWRVALYATFLRRVAGLSVAATVVGTTLPLVAIVSALAWLNLEQAVFEVMGGLRERTANDDAYLVVLVLTWVSLLALPVLLAWYAILAWLARRRTAS